MRKLVFIQGSAEAPTFPDFVWGDSWSFTMPAVPGASFYIEHIGPYPGSYDVPMPPTVTPETTGAYSYPTRNYSGLTAENTTLGPTRVWIDGWSGLESDPDFPDADVGVSLDVTVNNYFRLYWGDWDGDLPSDLNEFGVPRNFTEAEILGLTHGGVSGPSTRLCTTARNQELQFSALGSAKYRVIAVPYYLAVDGAYGQGDKVINTLRNSDHTQTALVPAADTPFADSQIVVINNVGHFIYVIESTASAFSVWLRFVEQAATGYSYTIADTPWSQSFSVPQIDPATAELISVDITMGASWQGRLWFENTSTLGTRTLTADLATSTELQVGGNPMLTGTTTSNFAPPTLTAFDGQLNYDGSSGYQYTTRFDSSSPSATLDSGDAEFSTFVGTGSVSVSVDAAHSVTVNPIAGETDPETLSILTFSKIAASGYVTLTYFKA